MINVTVLHATSTRARTPALQPLRAEEPSPDCYPSDDPDPARGVGLALLLGVIAWAPIIGALA